MVNFRELYRPRMGGSGPGDEPPVRVALVGAGQFGASLVAQSLTHPALTVPVIADVDPARAVAVLERCGVDPEAIETCDGAKAVTAAVENGRVAVVADGSLAVAAPVDVLVEATGHPEAAARNAEAAIGAGLHVVMATKEADVVCGAILAKMAADRDLVYTLPDGDQPSLLIGLIGRAELLGLEVAMAGKASEYDVVWNPSSGGLDYRGEAHAAPDFAELWDLPESGLDETLSARAAALGGAALKSVPDLCEMALVCNATGLLPDEAAFHAPLARTVELPDIFRPREDGGILHRAGTVDIMNCLRRPDELSLAGGVFVVVRCTDRETWRVIRDKGIPVSRCGGYGLLHNPVHLLGIEAAASILSAVKLGLPTSARYPRPRADLVGRATKDMAAGTFLMMGGHHHSIDGVEPLLTPAAPVSVANPLPFYLAANNRLTRPVAAGEIITADVVEEPAASELWRLRREQDRAMGLIAYAPKTAMW